MTNSNSKPKVHGDRICLKCKGICHEDSVRDVVLKGYGFRASYFCSLNCLIRWKISRVEKKSRPFVTDEEYDSFFDWVKADTLKDFEGEHPRYEYVDVITA